MKKLKKINIFFNSGYTLVEIIIVVGMISTLSGLILPSFLNWVRTEKVNSYTRELREYFRVIRLDARRWGSSCLVNINKISYEDSPRNNTFNGFTVTCKNELGTINSLAPLMNNSIFQITNKDFRITPNGRISSDKSIVVVIGSQFYNSGSTILNCLIIQSPTGHILKGNFVRKDWINNRMDISKSDVDNIVNENQCKT